MVDKFLSPDVSVIVINYNTFELTCACIESVITTTRETSYEIIIVDNNSHECNPDRFLEMFPDVKLIKNKINIGFGRANNQGMAVARGSYFLLLNSDCIILNDAVDLAFEFAIRRPSCKVFGATLLNEDYTDQQSYYRASRIGLMSPIWAVWMGNPITARLVRTRRERSNTIGGLYGAYIWLHRSVYELVGGFDPDFFMYCEDTEWFRNRISKLFEIQLCREARILHLGGGSGDGKIVNPQNILSYYLYWYKLGKPYFWIYTFGSIANLMFTFTALPFMSKLERARNAGYLKTVLRLIPKILWDIPKYNNKFGSRPSPLRVTAKREF